MNWLLWGTEVLGRVDGGITGRASPNTCIEGKLVAEFYLLGSPKCGTTSLAQDLIRGGLPSNVNVKESQFFFRAMQHNNGLCYNLNASSLKDEWLKYSSLACPTSERQVIADYSPEHLKCS